MAQMNNKQYIGCNPVEGFSNDLIDALLNQDTNRISVMYKTELL